jgi:type IX secretion system PorP/SprF family membrane protein
MKKNLISIFFILWVFLGAGIVMAQPYPSYGQYYFNRSLYNPSFVGNSKFIETAITHHQQWVGIDDAPSITILYFHYPTQGNVSLGVSAISDRSILLTSTAIMGTYSYRVPLGNEQHLKFGLSVGFGNNNIDLEEVNINDPAVFNAANSTLYMDGQFGVHYRWKHLEIGFSLPRVRLSQLNGPNKDFIFSEESNSRLGMKLLSANYKIPLKGASLVFEPGVLYRWVNDFDNQIEGFGILHIRDIVSLGGSYRENGAATAFFGVKFLDKLSLGYTYGTMPLKAAGIGSPGGTHEMQLKFWFGKNKKDINKKNDDVINQKGNETNRRDPSYLYNTRKRTSGTPDKK